jgi:hypothetical protein
VRLNRDRVLMNELCPCAVKLELKFRMRSTGIRILHAPLLMKLCNCTYRGRGATIRLATSRFDATSRLASRGVGVTQQPEGTVTTGLHRPLRVQIQRTGLINIT